MSFTKSKSLESIVSVHDLPFWVEPSVAFSTLACLPGAVLLESQSAPGNGRLSIICVNPFGYLSTSDGLTTIDLPSGMVNTPISPFDALEDILSRYAVPPVEGIPFVGGAVGYFGYELRTFIEGGTISPPDDLNLPDLWLGLYDCAAVFDHQKRTISLISCAFQDVPDASPNLARLEDHLERAARSHLPAYAETERHTRSAVSCLQSAVSREEYCASVSRVRDYIAAGDVYQVNLSQRYTAPMHLEPWELYRRLLERNPAPYAAYLNPGEFQIVSSSPECFVTYDSDTGMVETRPIKGTRPRHADPDEDRRLADELLASEKDRAENIMIVDLERNDIGRVCEYGSVRVPDITYVESYPTVHHLVSTVVGRLRPECDPVDLLKATFPGGSITGAPKIRAMEIIDELEPVRRGVYTGSIGYLGFDGAVNLNIAIRTATVVDGKCLFHVGGGIVWDSDPEAEYQETLDKGRAFFEVLGCE